MLVDTCPHCGKDMGGDSACLHCECRRKEEDVGRTKRFSGIPALLIIFLCFIVGAALFFLPEYLGRKVTGQFTACQSNQKNIGTALELYATDHQGHYPKYLHELIPAYLKSIPTCQAAGYDTYSATYRSSANPDAYTFCCNGDYHTQFTDNDYPQYNSHEGLVTRP